jgi:glycosyltransferase involved in cell wall biosynthesis
MRRSVDSSMAPAVSVVIPTHNYARYLGFAIDSLKRQTWTDWECVVVDDGSTDDTPQRLGEMAANDARIRVVTNARPLGPSAARNTGLATCRGEYVQFLDSDDLLGPNKLAHQMRTLTGSPQADLVYGAVRYFEQADDSNDPAWKPVHRVPGPSGRGTAVLGALIDANFMVVEAPLVRRSLLVSLGGFAEDLRRMEDWELWLRCALSDATFVDDESADADDLPLVRIHGDSSSQDQISMHKDAIWVRQRIASELVTPELQRLNSRRMNEHRAVIGMVCGFNGQIRHGIRNLLVAGIREKQSKLIAWAMLLPLVSIPFGRSFLNRVRARQARRRGEQPKDWQTTWL